MELFLLDVQALLETPLPLRVKIQMHTKLCPTVKLYTAIRSPFNFQKRTKERKVSSFRLRESPNLSQMVRHCIFPGFCDCHRFICKLRTMRIIPLHLRIFFSVVHMLLHSRHAHHLLLFNYHFIYLRRVPRLHKRR